MWHGQDHSELIENRWVFRLRSKELRDGSDLVLRGIEFQIVGASNRKAFRPMAIMVKGTCKRLSEEERRALLMVFKLMRDDKYEGVSDCRAR